MPTLLKEADMQQMRTFSSDEECRAASPSYPDICHACGATRPSTTDASYVRCGDARFCPPCWTQLTARQIAGAVRVVALRGVPLS